MAVCKHASPLRELAQRSPSQHTTPTLHIRGPTRSTTPNGIRIRAAVFLQYPGQTDRQTDTHIQKRCKKDLYRTSETARPRPTQKVALLKLLPPERSRNTQASQQTIFSSQLFSKLAFRFDFLREVGCRLTASSGDLHETSFLFQRLSILIQRFNSVLTLESFISTSDI